MQQITPSHPLTTDHLAELATEIRARAMSERDSVVIDALRQLAERLDGGHPGLPDRRQKTL